MKNVLITFMLSGSILLSLVACGNGEQQVSGVDVATGGAVSGDAVLGDAVSGNSVKSAVSGGAVEKNIREGQGTENGDQAKKVKQSSSWSKWYRNCNSTKVYDLIYNKGDGETGYLVQYDLDGSGERELAIRADAILWVSDKFICIRVVGKVYQIALSKDDQGESLDTENQECIIEDLLYDPSDSTFGDEDEILGMDDDDIYYINNKKKLMVCHLKNGKKRELNFSGNVKGKSYNNSYIAERKVFFAVNSSLYCIHRDTLEIEKVASWSKEKDFADSFVYMEESDEFYFEIYPNESGQSCESEVYVYDGNKTRCVLSGEAIHDVACRSRGLAKSDCYTRISTLYVCGKKIYFEYMTERDSDEECFSGMLVYERGMLHEDKRLKKQIKKYVSEGYEDCWVYGVLGNTLYIIDDEVGYAAETMDYFSYNLETGKLKKISYDEIRLLTHCEDCVRTVFRF